MSIERVTSYGNINISQEAIATLAGGVVSECYGVVGMASQTGEWNWIYISSSVSALKCPKSSVKYRRK